jgi:putative ABC transport system substrate-binding protein
MKKIFVFKTILFLFLFAICCQFQSFAKNYKVAVVMDNIIPDTQTCLDKAQAYLQNLGYKIDYSIFDLSKDDTAISSVQQGYDLILTFGTKSVTGLKSSVKDTPIVFCFVFNMIKYGLPAEGTASGTNLTGISMDFPVSDQLSLLKSVLPDASHVGVLSGPDSASLVDTAKAQQAQLGLQITQENVNSPIEVPGILSRLGNKIDVLWLLPDIKVLSKDSLMAIMSYSVKNNVPVMGCTHTMTKIGALFSYTYNFSALGSQAGEVINKILSGQKPGAIAISTPDKIGYSINLKIMRSYNLSIPKKIISAAEITIDN